jgi:ankyrin repeat protein
MTALMYAAQGGHLDIAKLLIDKGAHVDAEVSYY